VKALIIPFRRPFGIDKEFLIQLFVEPIEGVSVLDTQRLLTKMFLDQHITFVKVSKKSVNIVHQVHTHECMSCVSLL